MAISDVQAAKALNEAGFTGLNLVIAVAVAKAESGPAINPNAIFHEHDGSNSYGMMQINSVHPDVLKMGDWKDPVTNAKMAFRIWTESRDSWVPWGSYTSLRYQLYMEKAKTAVGELGVEANTPPTTATPVDNVVGLGSAAQSVTSFFSFISNSHNWYRLAISLLGAALLGIALLMMIKSSDTGKAIIKTASKAGEMAVLA